MKRKLLATVLAVTLLGSAGSVWALGVGVGYRIPTGDFGDWYDGGYGANAVMSFPVAPTITAYGDLGYTRFNNKLTSAADIDVWGFSGGAKFGLGNLYVGGEVGYFTEIDEFGISPLVGMGFGLFDISARYKMTGDANWFDIRASISFGP